FRRLLANLGGIRRGPAGIEVHVSADGPAQYRQRLQERSEARLPYRIVRGGGHEHADMSHALAVLRTRRERPRDDRAAEQRDELAPLHSITSSARPESGSGTVMPSALAVLRFRISSTFVDCTTGRSAGFSPLRIRPV